MIIKKISIKNNEAIIELDESKFVISLETYLNNNLLVNDDIDEKTIEELKSKDRASITKVNLLKKLSRKKLSKKECENILINNDLTVEEIKAILEDLEKNYLINDKELGEFIVDFSLMNKRGINSIKEKLIERKIPFFEHNYLLNEYLNREKYKKNIHYLLEKYKKMAKNKSKNIMKKYLCEKMIANGYNIEEFSYLIDVEDIEETPIIEKEITKFFKKNDFNNENIAKITKKLLSKGFNYDIIKKAIRECEDNETY